MSGWDDDDYDIVIQCQYVFVFFLSVRVFSASWCNILRASGGFVPRAPPRLYPWTPLGDFRPQTSCQCPSKPKSWIRPCAGWHAGRVSCILFWWNRLRGFRSHKGSKIDFLLFTANGFRDRPNFAYGFGYGAEIACRMTFCPVSVSANVVSSKFRYGRKLNLQFRHDAVAQHPCCPGCHWSGSGCVLWPLSCRPSAGGHPTLNNVAAHISVLTEPTTSLPYCCCNLSVAVSRYRIP